MVNTAVSSLATQASVNKSNILVPNAAIRPNCRALCCWDSGSLFARIEINTMLSMPRTISRRVSVNRLIQIAGSASQSIRAV